MMLLC